MATLTHTVIRALESDPGLYERTLTEVVEHMRREQALADRLEEALREEGFAQESGWVDWPEVIEYFRERASAEYLRNELRRNERMSHRHDPLPEP